ncbi:sodium-dependent noradrenaline transporter-like [Mizuhopecten yessoensis]|uniref:Transporter n=1 Tax=Mizuhopecten yessoensis TaxID=6573 RepID=A0A210QQ43_MIZYE|nr:sodium-dependent noradrenaline transporter-like [Mizuhopecten yessoensis]OWF50839.1 Sodium-dependent noradrenaline transporter [Mizuhopecten yessoensis]
MTRPGNTSYTELSVVASGCLDSESSQEFNTTIVNLDPHPAPRDEEIVPIILGHGDTPINNTPATCRRFDFTSTNGTASGVFAHTDDDVKENGVSDSDSSLEAPPVDGQRRGSKWSTTILFVASEVQLILNLAEFCPDEGFENAPRRKKTESSDDEEDDLYDDFDFSAPDQSDHSDSQTDDSPGDSDSTANTMELQAVIPTDISKDQIQNGKDPPRDCPDAEKNSLLSEKVDDIDDIPDHYPDDDDIKLPVENWGNKADYLLAVIGYSVDLSNVWRFPYLAYKNGGGAFIIPYFTVLLLGAIPVFMMELSMGQYTQEGPIRVWKMSPLFRGIGYASCLMAYIVAFYYNLVIGWSFYYLFSSFSSVLPWASCSHEFNSENCWQIDWDTNKTYLNRTYDANTSVSSAFEFYERGMLGLHKSNGINDLGPVKWELALCVLLTFVILYFSLWKSVKSAGKVVWFTATIPYLILTILLIRGSLLPGAGDGIKYFVTPNVSRLGDVQVWIDAAVQIFFSIGAGFGTHIAYASYNKFHNNCFRDCLITAGVNSFTSIFSGFVVFTFLGYMAARQNKDINDVAQDGPGLVFIVYPEAIATLPGSTAWSIIFFFMLVTLGMDSAFGGLESPLTGLGNQFYRLIRFGWSREILTFIIVCTAFLFSLPCTTNGGMYVFKILDTFAAGTSILFTVLCQVIAVSWVYGVDQFCRDVKQMTGYTPGMYWRICWKFICPTFLLILVISSFLHYRPLIYKGGGGVYKYPGYANAIGWGVASSTMALIPLYAIYKLSTTEGSFKRRLALCISPTREHALIERTGVVRRFKKEHWISI